MSYLFGQVPGDVLTAEPLLLAMLIFFGVTTLVGVAIWIASRRLGRSDVLAARHLGRLGQALVWAGGIALLVSGVFYEGTVLNRRFWIWLVWLAIYAVVFYALYFRYTRYVELQKARDAEQARRKRYIPAPHTLGMGRPTASAPGRPSNRKRRKANR